MIESTLFPGLIGGLRIVKRDLSTGNNELAIIIHALGTEKHPGGMPSLFYIRYLAEKTNSFTEVQSLINSKDLPASSHSLIVVDSQVAANFQFYPSEDKSYSLRLLNVQNEEDDSHELDKVFSEFQGKSVKKALVVTNDYRDPVTNQVMNYKLVDTTEDSMNRYNKIIKILADSKNRDPLSTIIKCQQTAQNYMTMVSEIIYIPRNGAKQIPSQRVFDISNAANNLIETKFD